MTRRAGRPRKATYSPPGRVASAMSTAYAITAAYGKRVPTWRDLADRFDMSRATAYRWVRAIKDARGLA